MLRRIASAVLAGLAIGWAGMASATVLASSAPTGPVGVLAANQEMGQNFYMRFVLDSEAELESFGIYTSTSLGTLGRSVAIRIRTESAGQPDLTKLYNFVDTIDTREVLDLGADGSAAFIAAHFSPITLGPGAYWISMTGPGNSELGWLSFDHGARFQSDQRVYVADDRGDLPFGPFCCSFAYRLEGTGMAHVPEPGTWALMLGGLGIVGGLLRRQRQVGGPDRPAALG